MLNIYRNCIQKISRMKERLTNKLLLLIKINQIWLKSGSDKVERIVIINVLNLKIYLNKVIKYKFDIIMWV
jgi:hypothetical protein